MFQIAYPANHVFFQTSIIDREMDSELRSVARAPHLVHRIVGEGRRRAPFAEGAAPAPSVYVEHQSAANLAGGQNVMNLGLRQRDGQSRLGSDRETGNPVWAQTERRAIPSI